ncbi:MAG: DUF2207 domain-containing protein [Chloroflexi bacterium]|nr:DUF2207 domain-containing protein [Chloroflexota bacterium]
MNQSKLGIVVLIVFVLFGNVAFGFISSAAETGDGRELQWDRFDVAIGNIDTANNRFDVVETYRISIETGPFTFGYRDVALNRLNEIRDVSVYDGETRLQLTCSSLPGTYCAQKDGDYFSIKYYFTSSVRSGSQRTLQIRYTVIGALRSYSGGDQLFWKALPEERAFPVRSSTITVTMPSDRLPEKTTSYPENWRESVDDETITWQSPGDLGKDKTVEVRVQYPHDNRMKEPSWQNNYDLEQSYIDNVQPIVSLLLVALTLFLTIGGILFVIVRYLSRGRDPKALVVPEYLTEPPTEELPGIVGLLLDEKADMEDIMATLVDLARRGFLVIEQNKEGGILGMFASTEFEFHRTEQPTTDLTGYEETLLRGLFAAGSSTSLDKLRTKFYQHIPAIKTQMYKRLIDEGYFERSPETTRSRWTWGGVGLLIVGSVLFWLSRDITIVSPMIFLPPIGMGLVGAVMALAGDYMPAKTLKGAQDAARWRAFRRYLNNIEKYSDVSQAAERFDQYIGYAVAFGLEKDLIQQVVPALKTVPVWYYPTHIGGPWHGGYHQRRTMSGGSLTPGDFSLGGPGGLNDMSQSLTQGLNSMSSGLTNMLNGASKAMTSRPQSSGRGGGFSGGGGRGGGSGGGRGGFG